MLSNESAVQVSGIGKGGGADKVQADNNVALKERDAKIAENPKTAENAESPRKEMDELRRMARAGSNA